MVIACTVAASSGRELRFLDSAPVVLALYQPWSTKVFAPSNEETHMIRFARRSLLGLALTGLFSGGAQAQEA
ncbi:MAG TPA: hypothetical protein PK797_15770, partial [Burkholderiaceae bacterium]|nr:hypothetical protein [Burkholderiaceae bacterium]